MPIDPAGLQWDRRAGRNVGVRQSPNGPPTASRAALRTIRARSAPPARSRVSRRATPQSTMHIQAVRRERQATQEYVWRFRNWASPPLSRNCASRPRMSAKAGHRGAHRRVAVAERSASGASSLMWTPDGQVLKRGTDSGTRRSRPPQVAAARRSPRHVAARATQTAAPAPASRDGST